MGRVGFLCEEEPVVTSDLKRVIEITVKINGLPREFYWNFGDVLGNKLLEVYNSAQWKSELTGSMNQEELIRLIYKRGEKEDTSEWRPVSLLNTANRILAKIWQWH
uniref:Uncharacterized protein n=1 Tax=Calidris pygmaea TaxID=425635 RepID=A0A8C3JDJ3_9CHAR